MEFTKEKGSTPLSVPLPLDPETDLSCDSRPYSAKRIWVGNIDTNMSEFVILKLLQPHGELEKIDFVYHKTGPDKGKPRGFCFATYSNERSALSAIQALHGFTVSNRKLIARHANNPETSSVKRITKTDVCITEVDKKSQIAAIEAKLKLMDQQPIRTNRNSVNPLKSRLDTEFSKQSHKHNVRQKPYSK